TSNGATKPSGSKTRTESMGYFRMDEPINMSRLVLLVERAVTSQYQSLAEADSQPDPPRLLVYLRDFGFLATFAPVCYRKIISSIRNQQSSRFSPHSSRNIPTAVILGASPLLTKTGLFQTEATRNRSRDRSLYSWLFDDTDDDSSEDESLDAWGEDKDAKRLREERLRQQHEMWSHGTLVSHAHENLAQTGVLSKRKLWRLSAPPHIHTWVVAPAKRNPEKERQAREERRLELNRLQIQMALLASGGELCFPLQSIDGADLLNTFTKYCKEQLIKCEEVKRLADLAIRDTLLRPLHTGDSAPIAISWDACCTAWIKLQEQGQECADWLEGYNTGDSQGRGPTDPLVQKIKKGRLNKYEKKILECLFSNKSQHLFPGDIQTGFDSIRLPSATIDAIRTLVSLPLVYPEAFYTGILKRYNMSGALLFGPPGTGKTLLAKAVAKESGARMISIKPSDILDKYVGETEKIVSALFEMARRLKPCLIFIDEVDALLGARALSPSTDSSAWRGDMLTQFMQEMDGLLSSDVVVIGATNRPFNLDEAIIRRLPCRILVDLPDKDIREEILNVLMKDEELEPEVNLGALASQTPFYSGSDLKSKRRN
ncbi:unnamed protein product, partial [Rhizoctonia solani]